MSRIPQAKNSHRSVIPPVQISGALGTDKIVFSFEILEIQFENLLLLQSFLTFQVLHLEYTNIYTAFYIPQVFPHTSL